MEAPGGMRSERPTASALREKAEVWTAVATEGVLRGEGYGVDHAVELAPALSQVAGYGLDVLRLVDVELQDRGLGVEPLGGPLGQAAGAAEAAEGHLGALLGGQAGCGVRDGTAVQDARHQHLLAFQQSRHLASKGSVRKS